VTIPENAHQHYRTFQKKFNKVIQLSEKSPARLPVFSKNVYQSYRTFQKISGKVPGLFGKNEGSKYTSPHLIVSGTLPDFPKKPGKVIGLSRKKFSKVTGLFKNCPAKLSDFSKKVHQSYRSFQKIIGSRAGNSGKKTGQVWI
jgi:hypothetical protein